ncbi:hypothetical protein FEM48_Zijuj11G0037400 [Ziziphus jujuba var. spinosa]|uniref:Uncharacterized protein n=1 Tax=Ziziphus jujuba var. spinosa TaxID=714518 RepID=A0A978UGM1_ZIZJJ|nr:hypothetical protein FEM48_Zijuj11G0037400 [Ziziphus jujuba var. spinosa]
MNQSKLLAGLTQLRKQMQEEDQDLGKSLPLKNMRIFLQVAPHKEQIPMSYTRKAAQDRNGKLAFSIDLEIKSLKQVVLMGTAVKMDKQKVEELLKHFQELSDAILMLKVAISEIGKVKFVIISEKGIEIEVAKMDQVQEQEKLKDMRLKRKWRKSWRISLMPSAHLWNQEALTEGFKMELKNENDLASKLSSDFEMLNNDTKEAKDEIDKGKRSRSAV